MWRGFNDESDSLKLLGLAVGRWAISGRSSRSSSTIYMDSQAAVAAKEQ